MKTKVLITGASGMVGRSLIKELANDKTVELLLPTKNELNYLNYSEVEKYFKKKKPKYVYMLAAKVGGILANSRNKVEFFEENQIIQINLFKCIRKFKIKKSIFLGSSCIYPKNSKQPIKENTLLTGRLEESNEGYALAKISGVRLAKYYNEKYSTNIICPMLCNIYGTNDNFNYEDSHVLSALIRRFSEAKKSNKKEVKLWGSGNPRREFIHVTDAAKALVFLMNKYDGIDPINVGTGYDVSIKKLAIKISKSVGYSGKIKWDKSKPDGVARKLLDISKISRLGFKPRVDLKDGIERTVNEFNNLKKKGNFYIKNYPKLKKDFFVNEITPSIKEYIGKNYKYFFFNKKKYWYPLSLPTYNKQEINQALDSMTKYRTTMWKKTDKFEKKFSNSVKSKHAVMVNSGSSSDLLMSFGILDKTLNYLKKGDEIIIPILTWPTHIWSAMMAGFKVKLVDINLKSLNIDIDQLKKNITKKTKAIFLVHALGNPCNMDKIKKIAKEKKLIILEDCCEALGSKFGGKYVGNFGLAASYSFFFSHHISTMEGGMVVTNNKKFYKNLKYLRSHGWRRGYIEKSKSNIDVYDNFKFVNWGFNLRPTELQAGFGIEQMKKLKKFNLIRKKYYNLFVSTFKNNKNIYFPSVEKKSDPSWFAIPIILNKDSNFSRKKLLNYLEKNGIETRPIIVGNLARHPVGKIFNEFSSRKFPNADYIHNRGFYIGLSPLIQKSNFIKMINIFKKFFIK